MIHYTNFKLVKGKMVPYERKQGFMEKDRIPIILTANPLILVRGKLLAGPTSLTTWLNDPSQTKMETISNISEPTQFAQISLPCFLVEFDMITIINFCSEQMHVRRSKQTKLKCSSSQNP